MGAFGHARLLVCVLGLAGAAWAQHPFVPGMAPPERRPLHLRLGEADAAAIGRVAQVEAGRIRIEDAEALLGEVAASFELKRSPSNPPGVAEGERALWLLRGARTPYLLVDGAAALERIADDAQAAAWAGAVRDLAGAPEPAARGGVYASWLDSELPELARAGAVGLASEGASPDSSEDLLELATASTDRETRRYAARGLVRSRAGADALLARLPDVASPDVDVLSIALMSALPEEPERGRAALLRALAHATHEIRGAALAIAVGSLHDPPVRARVGEIAYADPDDELRAMARRALATRHTQP